MIKKIIEDQQKICQKYSAEFSPVEMDSLIGISDNTNGVYMPINGLRHPQEGNTSGWYIWSGELLSKEDNFFKPKHTKHLIDRCPQILKFLALPPGYRFLVGENGYIDVWYDSSLLSA